MPQKREKKKRSAPDSWACRDYEIRHYKMQHFRLCSIFVQILCSAAVVDILKIISIHDSEKIQVDNISA